MTLICKRRLALLIILVAGCHSSSTRQMPAPNPPVVGRGTPAVPKPLVIPERPLSPARQPDALDEQGLLVPPARPTDAQLAAPAVKPLVDPNIKLAKATQESDPVGSSRVADEALDSMKRVHQNAVASFAKMDSFDARLTRRETIDGKANPQEIIHFMFRKQPFSVRLKWLGTEGQGREVVYVQGQHDGKMHIMPTKQDAFPLPPMRMSFLPDSSMVRSKSRHDIRDAGLGTAIRQFGNVLDLIAKNPGQRNRLRYLGLVTRPEYASKMEAIEETIPPKTEPLLMQGGKRVVFFDTGADSPSLHLPVLVVTHDSTGKEVEYYCFDRVTTRIRLTDADFDPDLVLKKK